MTTSHTPAVQKVAVAPNGGSLHHFLGHLATVKVPADGERTMSVVEFLAPHGFGPPLHRHEIEDELFIVLDGELVLHTGGEQIPAPAGAVAYLPRAVAHTFQVVSATSRFINVTTATAGAPRFDEMVTALGEPTATASLPPPGPIDPARVADVCREHGIEILGPPPPRID